MKDFIYLDHAAATPMDSRVLQAMLPYLQAGYFNPSAQYLPARRVRDDIEAARSIVAAVLGCRPAEIVFTAGGTEANNLAVRGVMARYPDANVLVSAIEHDAIIKPADQYAVRSVAVHGDGRLDMDDLGQKIDDNTVLVTIMLANNEIGVVQDVREIAQHIEKIRKDRARAGNRLPLYLHTDACQAAPYMNLHIARLGVDLLTLNGSKMYGPKQTGVLFVRGGVVLEPIMYGGGQEAGLRSGTENVPGIIGFAAALDLVQSDREIETRRLQVLRDEFIQRLKQIDERIEINGSIKYRLPNNVHVTFPGVDNERLIMQLDLAGIAVAAGSACSARAGVASHVLAAVGMDRTTAQNTIRFTFGRQTSQAELDRVIATLDNLL